jgi:hypothetical protein
MASVFQILLRAHIGAGAVALLLFWIPAIAPKGGKVHIRAGLFYAVCMSIVVLTALTMSGLTFAAPLTIRGIAPPPTPAGLALFLRNQRIFATFLGYLGTLTLAAGWQGISAIQTKKEPRKMRNPFALALNALVILGGFVVLFLGIRYGHGPLIGMSPIGPLVGVGNLKYLLRGPQSRMHWWYAHLSSMLATGIAGYTAFIVIGGAHLLPSLARTQFFTIFWVLPSLVGVPTIFATVAYYRRKFHETGHGGDLPQAQISV